MKFHSRLALAPLILSPFSPLLLLPSNAQTVVDFGSCSASECRLNQSIGTTNSVSVGVTSSFGSNSSAQGSLHHSANSSSNVSLQSPTSDSSELFGKNVNYQAIGGNFSNVLDATDSIIRDPSTNVREQDWVTAPVNISINTNTTKSSAVDGTLNQQSLTDETGASSSSTRDGEGAALGTQYQDEDVSSSTASFSAEGLSAYQDLSLTGEQSGNSGSYAKSSVTQLVRKEGGTPIYKRVPIIESVPVFNTDGSPKMERVLLEENSLPILKDGLLQYVEKQVHESKIIDYKEELVGFSNPDGNPILEDDFATGSASAGVNSSTRFSADVTSSNFVNAFMSSF